MREEKQLTRDELNFLEWETVTFGAGYGTGELPILTAVKTFFQCLEGGGSYDYQTLEARLGDTVTWLLINAFDRASLIEWGTSARNGWLTSCGEYVRDFIKSRTPDELYEIVMTNEDSLCLCNGEITDTGHEFCGKNPMVNEKYANELKYD